MGIQLLQYRDTEYRVKDMPVLSANPALHQLLDQRKKEITLTGTDATTTEIGQRLSDLNALQGLLERINNNLYEQNKIIYKLVVGWGR
ncbi:MAG: hypothetical protein QM610_15670 [Chitinophagaceae bacterium]